jgi:CheY-like chemotaxis protein/tetratricopeptide (TPR) repeat protein
MAGTVLYIDDALELPRGSDAELRRLGFRLAHTDDPEEAVRLARETEPRLVLLEVLIESCDGWELLEQIRSAEEPAGHLPVVILTRGERSPDLYGRAVELEVVDFLCKPVLRPQLLSVVLECAQRDETASLVDPARSEAAASSDAEFSGDLADVPLPELLHRLRRIAATGVLLIQHEAENRGIQLRNGSPIAVASNRGIESLEDFLVRTKQISGLEHEEVIEQASVGRGSPREILVGMGVLSEEEVEAALRARAAEPLLEGFGWALGSYRFEEAKRLPAGRALELEQSPARLLLDGALQWMPSALVRRLIDRRGGQFISRADRAPYPLEETGLSAYEQEFLDGLLGDRTIAEVLGPDERQERLVYGLLVAGLAELHREPVLLLREVLEAPLEDSAPAESDSPLEAGEPFAYDEELDWDEEDLLDADSPATLEEPRPDGGAARQAEEGAARSLEAEGWFRKGEGFLAMKRYVKAVEAFGMAAHLDPSQGEYSAHLGYALHLNQPRNELVRREALEHIAKGIKLSPDSWKPLVFLGCVFRAAGEPESARKVLRRALKIQPDCDAARHELRLLEQPEKPRSLLERLLDRWIFNERRRS